MSKYLINYEGKKYTLADLGKPVLDIAPDGTLDIIDLAIDLEPYLSMPLSEIVEEALWRNGREMSYVPIEEWTDFELEQAGWALFWDILAELDITDDETYLAHDKETDLYVVASIKELEDSTKKKREEQSGSES